MTVQAPSALRQIEHMPYLHRELHISLFIYFCFHLVYLKSAKALCYEHCFFSFNTSRVNMVAFRLSFSILIHSDHLRALLFQCNMKSAPQGQMVINMKTTITTHGSHSGFVVHSGILSNNSTSTGAPSSSSNQGSMWSVGPPSRLPIVETPQGTRIVSATSPHPIQMVPSTSQENINTSWSRISNHSPLPAHTSIEKRFEYAPDVSYRSRSHDNLANERNRSRYESPARRPVTPPSPVYHFDGRDSPPDEFITPSRVTLNVFEPEALAPKKYEVGLRRAETAGATDALINDTVTTTTTVEVFRTPIDPSNPTKLVALPPPPVPALDDRPQLLRLQGPNYERWSSHRTETLINDRPVTASSSMSQRGVQWKENLVEGSEEADRYLQQAERYDPYNGIRSPFAESIQPLPPTSNQTYHVPTVHSIDPRLYSSPVMMQNRSTSPYMIKSPSEASVFSHQIITSSHEELRPPSTTSYLSAPRMRESPSQLAQIRTITPNRLNDTNVYPSPGPQSPIYVEPIRRTRKELVEDLDRYSSREYESRSRADDKDSRIRDKGESRTRSSREKNDDRSSRKADFTRYENTNSDRESARRHEKSGRDSRSNRHRDRDYDRHSRGVSSPRSSEYKEHRQSEHGKRRSHSHYRQRDSNRESRRDRHHRSQSPESRRTDHIASTDERQSRSRTQVARTTYDPKSRSISIERDPNYIDGVPQHTNMRDHHSTLYQTRDIMDNIVSQFEETEFLLDDGLLLSPLAESEDSLISELSTRNDKTKSDYLELRTATSPRYANIIHGRKATSISNNLLPKPRVEEHVYAEPDKSLSSEHIYEELDGYRNITPQPTLVQQEKVHNAPQKAPKKNKISMELAEFLETEEVFEEVTTTTTTTTSPRKLRDIHTPTGSQQSFDLNSPIMEKAKEKPKPELIPPIIVIDKEVSVDDTSSSEEWPDPPPQPPIPVSPPPLPTCPPPQSPPESPKLEANGSNAIIFTKPVTVRKAHPGGLVFPRVTFSLPTLPQLPEDRELSARFCDDSGLTLVPMSNEQAHSIPVKPPPPPASTKPKLGIPSVVSQSHKLYISDWEALLNDEFDSDSNTLNEDLSYH